MTMKKMIGGLFGAAMLVAISLQTHAQGALVYDQQSATNPYSIHANYVDGLNIQEDSPLLQSFVPARSAIDFVQLEFWDIPNNGNNGATVYVNLWTGSTRTNTATFLGSTTPVYMPNGFMDVGLGGGVTNFYFLNPVALAAGQTYYLQPVVLSGDDPWDILTIGDTYPDGRLYGSTGGYFQPSVDFWFREGFITPVPEPSTLALIGLGGLFVFIFKRRSKLVVPLLFAASVLSVQAAGDSVVQATADAAGLAPATALPRMGTFWIMTTSPNGRLTALPYPALPSDLSALPAYSVAGNIYILDDTGGKIVSSSAQRMNNAQAAAIAQAQAETMAGLLYIPFIKLPIRVSKASETAWMVNNVGFSTPRSIPLKKARSILALAAKAS